MQKATRIGVSFLLALTCTAFAGWSISGAEAADPDVLGIRGNNGEFRPMVRVKQQRGRLTVRKIRPNDRYDAVRIKFVFPGAERRGAMNGMAVQWEKEPGRRGRVWPLMGHRGFNPRTEVFEDTWKRSIAFTIIDKTPRRWLERLPWTKVVRMWIDGKALVAEPPPPTPAPEPRPAPTAEILQPADPEPAPPPENPRAPERARAQPPPVIPSIDRTAQKELTAKFDRLSARIQELEETVAGTRKWSYRGPLIALVLSIFFTTVAVFLTYLRLSRSQNYRVLAPPQYQRPRPRSTPRFRNTGS